MGELPLISVIIPVYNQVELLRRCLVSLEAQRGVRLQIIVVDDASPEDPGPVVEPFREVQLCRSAQNIGYAAANNLGLERGVGDYLLFLNSDTELPPNAIASLVRHLEQTPEAAGVAPLHRGCGGEVQRTCYRFPTVRLAALWDSAVHHRRPDHPVLRDYAMTDWDHQTPRWVEHAQTSCLLVRSVVYQRIGGMDPQLFLFYNDTDFCYRMHRNNFRIWFLPDVEIIHHGSASVCTFERAETHIYADRYRYLRKWFGARGCLAMRWALWSRVAYELASELRHGQWRLAAGKVRKGLRLTRAIGGMP